MLCIIALLMQTGCVSWPTTVPPPPSEELRAKFGVIGVVPAQFLPNPDFRVPAKGRLAGAGRRAANWAAAGAAAPLSGGGGGGAGAIILLAFSVTAGTIGGLAGTVSGAVHAESAAKVSETEAVLKNALVSLKMQETMLDRVVRAAQNQARQHLVVLPDKGPESPEEKIDYRSLAAKGIDTVVEVAITSFGLAGPWDVNPLLNFALDSRVRVVRTSDGGELYETSFKYRGGEHTFFEWAAANGQPLCEELDRAYQALAEKIVEELFLLYRSPVSPVKDDIKKRWDLLRKNKQRLPPGTGTQ